MDLLIDIAAVTACVLYLVSLMVKHELRERGYTRS